MGPSFTSDAHPSPHRGRVPAWLLVLGPCVAAAAWLLNLLINYLTAANGCEGAPSVSTIASVEVLAVGSCAAAGLVCYRAWGMTHDEKRGSTHHLAEAGEGRTRFLALWGTAAAGLFVVAIAFGAVALVAGVPCG